MQKQFAIKIGIIGFITLCLLIPLTMIGGKIYERKNYLYEAEQNVAQSWTGSQQLMTPIIVQAYEVITLSTHRNNDTPTETATRHLHYIPLDTLTVSADIITSLRYKGIYSIPVYQATLAISGKIANKKIQQHRKAIEEQPGFSRFFKPSIAVYISDARGVAGKPTLSWMGETQEVLPGSGLLSLTSGLRSEITLPRPSDEFLDINVAFQLRGMTSLEFIPAAKNSQFTAQSNWPHPEFIGAFLPGSRSINSEGFISSWQVNEFSSGIDSKLFSCASGNCQQLLQLGFGARMYQAVDIYLQTERSTKYGILFIVLCFASFFLFEITRKKAIHPIQYLFVGLALAIFYLLLISLSEHLSFLLAYSLSSSACIALLFFYIGNLLGGFKASAVFCSALAGLYSLLYIIIQMEDFALLMGTLLLFAVLSLVMLSTRKIDWYKIGLAKPAASESETI
ncbi:inner membrane protein [Alteromonadaceae bacterium Bs31]|nr:inner membrane protein [Alteromonadaceae bacterium Bs31]